MAQERHAGKSSTAALTLAALGIVFGDIGTSPLYAVKETFAPAHGIALDAPNVLGGLSTMFWALMVVVSLKYVVLMMRADNRGEGGIMALIALAQTAIREHPRWRLPLLLIGAFGASLFYGDAVLTPAISVLSAVEGLEIGTAALKPYVVPVAVGVLLALFAIQRRGTAAVGRLFGLGRLFRLGFMSDLLTRYDAWLADDGPAALVLRAVERAVRAGREAADQARAELESRLAETKAAYNAGAQVARDAKVERVTVQKGRSA